LPEQQERPAPLANADPGKCRRNPRLQRTVGLHRSFRSHSPVFIAPSDHTLRVYRSNNGHARKGSPVKLVSNFKVSPLLLGDVLAYPVGSDLIGLDASKLKEAGKFTAPSDITSGIHHDPATGLIFFGCRNGELIAAAPQATLKRVPFADEPAEKPTVSDSGTVLPFQAPQPRETTVAKPTTTNETVETESEDPGKADESKPELELPPEKTLTNEETTAPREAEVKPIREPGHSESETRVDGAKEAGERPAVKDKNTVEEAETQAPSLTPEKALAEAKALTASGDLKQAAELWRTPNYGGLRCPPRPKVPIQ